MLEMILTDKEKLILERIKEGKPFVVKGEFQDVLTIKEFENLLNLTPFTNTQRFETTFSISRHDWPLPYWHTGTDHWPINIIKKFTDTGVCYIKDCSRASRKINSICSYIEAQMDNAVDAHIYFSKHKSLKNGFGLHKDFAHNFVIQVDGQTRWQVGTNHYTQGPRGLDKFNSDDTISIDVILEPGDAIFAPAYVYHSTENLSKRISVSFPLPEQEAKSFERREWLEWNKT